MADGVVWPSPAESADENASRSDRILRPIKIFGLQIFLHINEMLMFKLFPLG